MNKASFGTVSHGTLRNQDLLARFNAELVWLSQTDRTNAESALIAQADSVTDYDSDEACELVNELIDALNIHAPENCYFGALEGDGSDFGFWPIE